MPGIDVLANVVAVLIGGVLGLGGGRFLAERFQATLMRACALVVIFLGRGGALSNLSYVGSILIFTVGTNLMTLPYIRVANFLPALVIAVVWGVM